MSLRTASGFLESSRDGREIWLGGERVVDVTTHPLLRGAALTIAGLYALQHRPDLQDRLSLPIDGRGERIGYSHIQPRTRDELRRRREMIKLWADENGGMLARTPDASGSEEPTAKIFVKVGSSRAYFRPALTRHRLRIHEACG